MLRTDPLNCGLRPKEAEFRIVTPDELKLASLGQNQQSNYEAIEGAEALIVVTDWNEYRHPDFERIKAALKNHVVIGLHNIGIKGTF